MSEQLIYLAHQVSGDVPANLASASRLLGQLRRLEPGHVISAPWLANMLAGIDDDADPRCRARALWECQRIAARFDGIVLVGPRISIGMQLELEAVQLADGWVSDLTGLDGETIAVIASPLEYGRIQWNRRAA